MFFMKNELGHNNPGSFLYKKNYPDILAELGKGDVACYDKKDFVKFCQKSRLKLELFEQRKGFRLHSVMRKKAGEVHRL